MKVPDLIDFFVFHGINKTNFSIFDSYDLSSDHTPITVVMSSVPVSKHSTVKLIKSNTNLDTFRHLVHSNINLKVPLKSPSDIENCANKLTETIYEAAKLSTPIPKNSRLNKSNQIYVSYEIRALIMEKRKLRKIWQVSRCPNDKRILNKACETLKKKLILFKNDSTSNYLKNLKANDNNNCLWNATKYLKRPVKRSIPIKDPVSGWCRSDQSKANLFASHLTKTFGNHVSCSSIHENKIVQFLSSPCPMELPITPIKFSEVITEIEKLNLRKAPGQDLINAMVVRNFPKKAILMLLYIYNAILRLGYFPSEWKVAKIIMIVKPNKPENVVTSYRPISLLNVFSKIFERIFLGRLLKVINKNNIIPDHQFGFRSKHGATEQCHRVVNTIRDALERKMYCSGAFLDVKQAFDRVWHKGLLYKLKMHLPTPYYLLFRSYLDHRRFFVQVNEDKSDRNVIGAGVPQGSVLGPVLYTLYTADMPISPDITIATFADDTAFLSTSTCPTEASQMLQQHLDVVMKWLDNWKIEINAEKSVHVTFTLKRGDCPPVTLNGTMIPQKNSTKYLGFHLDRRLTWRTHIKTKRNQLNMQSKRMYWLLGPYSELSLHNKLLLYKTILKPIWTWGIQIWGSASASNICIIQRFQSKTLRLICGAPWYVRNEAIHRDLHIATVIDEIKKYSVRYLDRLDSHSNPLAINLLDNSNETYRLKRKHILDLPFT